MKLHIPKNWIRKFKGEKDDPFETIPIGPIENPIIKDTEVDNKCGCGKPAVAGGWCQECIDYLDDDEDET